MAIWPIFLILLLGLGLAVPIGVAMGLAALVFIMINGLPLSQLPQMCYSSADSLVLIAIPMFLLAGTLMEKGGLTRRLVDFSNSLVGGVSGGLGAVTVMTCALFAALSGSGPATTAAVGGLLVPEMMKKGYPAHYSGGLAASAGGIGIVIPPSIPLIMYGIMAQQSISRLFLAGFLPGILLAVILLLANSFLCKRRGYGLKTTDRLSLKKVIRQTWESRWALLAPVIILGGIYSGITTVTEASAIAVFYALFTGLFVYKKLNLNSIWEALVRALQITGVSFILLSSGRILARQFVVANIPEIVTNNILALTNDRTVILLLTIGLLIFIGMWMETIAQIIVLTPVFLPIMEAIGVNPIHFGIIFIVACEVGFQTPPLGANLFIAKELGGCSYEDVSKIGLIFAVVEIFALIIIAFVPEITLFLPRLLMGN